MCWPWTFQSYWFAPIFLSFYSDLSTSPCCSSRIYSRTQCWDNHLDQDFWANDSDTAFPVLESLEEEVSNPLTYTYTHNSSNPAHWSNSLSQLAKQLGGRKQTFLMKSKWLCFSPIQQRKSLLRVAKSVLCSPDKEMTHLSISLKYKAILREASCSLGLCRALKGYLMLMDIWLNHQLIEIKAKIHLENWISTNSIDSVQFPDS